ncbi:MAG: glucosidase [Opitutales bacterium]
MAKQNSSAPKRNAPTPAPSDTPLDPERQRLVDEVAREGNWKRWGTYLPERQWGTVREDYSHSSEAWNHFPHDQARSRAYRWGEDGLLGWTDRQCRLCLAPAFWNGQDPILKERLFGLSGPQGNHGEDVKECYYYLDATPTHSWAQGLYKYPQQAFPYDLLIRENGARGYHDREFELLDSGIFDENRYFDIFVEYAKAGPNDTCMRLRIINRGPEKAPLHVLAQLWFRNTWIWGCEHEGCTPKPQIDLDGQPNRLRCRHVTLNEFVLEASAGPDGEAPRFLFTENETNIQRLYGTSGYTRYVKDAFHRHIIQGEENALHPQQKGTKAAAWYALEVEAGAEVELRLRLGRRQEADNWSQDALGQPFEETFQTRIQEADTFYKALPASCDAEDGARVRRQAYAGLLWTKQFYHYSVKDWLKGDPDVMTPPQSRWDGRNSDWAQHFFCRDILSMPDKWEYPWFAAWDSAFHMIPFARIDPHFAQEQLVLFLREWYMHPNGEIPAYEWNFSDVNPPVHAWAVYKLYKLSQARGQADTTFLARCFHKLLINFTWWVNRKDPTGKNLFSGGFLGLDNIGLFDRSKPLPTGGHLEQADGTAWMAFYCGQMLAIALELAHHDSEYEDVASKFFEHFVGIAEAVNTLGSDGLWDDEDGFYYDQIRVNQNALVLKIRSMVGLLPICAVQLLSEETIEKLPGFKKRMDWFLEHRKDLAHILEHAHNPDCGGGSHLLAIPAKGRLQRILPYLFDENEFLSPYGIRSLSKFHERNPYVLHAEGDTFKVHYTPGESDNGLFGGNSNWRGPIWFPVNFLLIEALRTWHRFYGDDFKVDFPTGSGNQITLAACADKLSHRLVRLFLRNDQDQRPSEAECPKHQEDPYFRDLLNFYEYFHGDTGQGLGASKQTGWTALVATLLEDLGSPKGTS